MSRRRVSSSKRKGISPPPTALYPRTRLAVLSGMMLGLLGMVTLFGGTRFWASGPFILLSLGIACGFLIFSAVHCTKNQRGIGLPADYFLWLPILVFVWIRAAFFTPIPFETWTEFGFLWIAWVLYGVMADLGNQSKAWVWAAFIFLFGICFHTFWAVSQHWHGNRMVLWVPRPDQYGMRASGTYICPNHFAHFLMMGIVVAFACLLTPKAKVSLRIFSGYVLLPASWVLVLTHSRSGLIGAFVGMSLIGLGLAMRRGWKRVLATSLAVAGSGVLVVYLLLQFYPPMRARMVRDIKDNIRISQVWPDTWSMIKAEGLWGAGPGVYANVFEKYREHFSSFSLYLEYAHNEFLHTLAEYGWPASFFMLGLLVWMGVFWIRAALRSSSTSSAMIPLTMLGLLSGSLAHAVFDFNLHIPANGFLLVALLGLLYGQGLHQGIWERRPLSPAYSKFGMIFVVLICLVLLPYVARLTVGGWYEYRMRLAIESGETENQFQYAAKMRDWMPWYARGWTQKGFAYRNQAFFAVFDAEKRESAIAQSRKAYETALSKNPYEKIALAGLVELARLEKKPEDALELVLKLRELAPFDIQVRIQHGLILRELGRHAEALAVFEEAQKRQGASSEQIQLNIKRLRKILAEEARLGKAWFFTPLSVDRLRRYVV
jgi:O-antigen ligase